MGSINFRPYCVCFGQGKRSACTYSDFVLREYPVACYMDTVNIHEISTDHWIAQELNGEYYEAHRNAQEFTYSS